MSDIAAVDIGSYEIKVASGSVDKNGLRVQAAGSSYNPTGLFLPEKDEVLAQLATTLKQSFKDHNVKTKNVWTCMPETLAYTNIISMPQLSDAELSSSIYWEAEQHIPVPVDDLHLEYEVLYRPSKDSVGEKMKILLVGAKKVDVERIIRLFKMAGVDVVGLETSMVSTFRALSGMFQNQAAFAVVHMGALSTDILIVENGEMMLSYSASTGGLALTKAIQNGLNLTPSQAEEYKRTYGLDPNQLEGKVKGALEGILKLIVAEIRKAIQYYQSSKMMNPISGIVMSGGSAYLPGLNTYMAQTFGAEVVTANPFSMVDTSSFGQAASLGGALYTPTIGLMLHKD